MNADELEFLICQLVEGTLADEKRKEVEEILRCDPEARRLHDEHQKLSAAISGIHPLPAVHWERLADHISSRIDEHLAPPVYSMRAYRPMLRVGLALAASVLLAIGLWHDSRSENKPAAPGMIVMNGPQAESPAGAALIDISVDRPHDPETAMRYIYEDNLLVKQSVVALDSNGQPPLQQIH